jgi:hypothetical protein
VSYILESYFVLVNAYTTMCWCSTRFDLALSQPLCTLHHLFLMDSYILMSQIGVQGDLLGNLQRGRKKVFRLLSTCMLVVTFN